MQSNVNSNAARPGINESKLSCKVVTLELSKARPEAC